MFLNRKNYAADFVNRLNQYGDDVLGTIARTDIFPKYDNFKEILKDVFVDINAHRLVFKDSFKVDNLGDMLNESRWLKDFITTKYYENYINQECEYNSYDEKKNNAWKNVITLIVKDTLKRKKRYDGMVYGGYIKVEDLLQQIMVKVLELFGFAIENNALYPQYAKYREQIFELMYPINSKKFVFYKETTPEKIEQVFPDSAPNELIEKLKTALVANESFREIKNIHHYVGFIIRNEFYDYVNNQIYPYSVQRNDIDTKLKLNKFKEMFYVEKGRDPSEEELMNSGITVGFTYKKNTFLLADDGNIVFVSTSFGEKYLCKREEIKRDDLSDSDFRKLFDNKYIVNEDGQYFINNDIVRKKIHLDFEGLGLMHLEKYFVDKYEFEKIMTIDQISQTDLYKALTVHEKEVFHARIEKMYKVQRRRLHTVMRMKYSIQGGVASNSNSDKEFDDYYFGSYDFIPWNAPLDSVDALAEAEKYQRLMRLRNSLMKEMREYNYNEELTYRENLSLGLKNFLKMLLINKTLNSGLIVDIEDELNYFDELSVSKLLLGNGQFSVKVNLAKNKEQHINLKMFMDNYKKVINLLFNNYLPDRVKNSKQRSFQLLFD